MNMNSKFAAGMLAMGLMAMPSLGRAQERREHRELDLQSLPSPMEAIRNLQNTGRMAFMLADVNHDGQISQKEAIDANNLMVGGFFFEADADGNGSVSPEEMRTIRETYLSQNPWTRYVVESIEAQQKGRQNSNQPNSLQGLMAVIDSNSDKQIQAKELRQLVQTFTQTYFSAADTNRDGQMSPSEVNASLAGAVRAMGQFAFQQADADNNGQLSRAEYDKSIVEPANVVFQILDLNHDGQLSQQEAQQTEQAFVSQIRLLQLPEPANSPTNLIESGKTPAEAAPVPSFTSPNQNRPQQRTPAQPGSQPTPRR